jgi:phosphoribosylaminoimidazolecarboxamide formyltransferase/IMP cyclohydrolase/phosphoribosylaminoimidazolecarboxamide formyltransferase
MSSYGDFIALSDVCDETTAKIIHREVSDGIIAPGYTDAALELLKSKKKGNYNVIKIDPSYRPAELEHKQVFGVTFEQKRNDYKVTDEAFSNIVTKKKELTAEERLNLTIALITLKYTQSNSVAYAEDGQAIGVGAGQQSRIHCTRLAGDKADHWHLRQTDRVLNLPFKDGLRRADWDNVIDVYLSEECDDVLKDGAWQQWFTEQPAPFTRAEQKAYLATLTGTALGSDAFFPFGDNIERARKSGVSCVAEPGGSIRDDNVIEVADKYDMGMAFTGMRLFHH